MTTTASPAAIAGYVHAMTRAFAPDSAPGRRLTDWLRVNASAVGVDFDAVTRPRAKTRRRRKAPANDRPLPKRAWQQLSAAIAEAANCGAGRDDVISTNLAAFAAAVGLGRLEMDVFRFVFHTDREPAFGDLCTNIVATRIVDSMALTAIAIGSRPAEVWGHLVRGPLHALRLVDVPSDAIGQFTLYVPHRIRHALLPPNDGLADIERRLIGASATPTLGWEDFGHVARERDFILRLLEGALAARRKGVNILLYGSPGTGKTEFCKAVAARLGVDLFGIGEADEDGDEPSRDERIDALRLSERLAIRRGKALLLFDEMEDILQRGDRAASGGRWVRRSGSKVFFNRLLEENSVPVLWTANALDEFDPAFLRRMTFAFEMKAPPLQARARLWQGLAEQHGLQLPAESAAKLARRHKVAPSLMTGAAQAVAMAGGTAEEIDFVVAALASPMGCGRPAEDSAQPVRFQPELANVDLDLAALEAALTRAGAPRDVSLCLYGPPGTGKSAFGRRLAERMGIDVLPKRGSDLLSPWIGETEQRIAAAFEEARRDERFLLIDEAEAFLWSRASATRSWQTSMVNELLVAMERHPLPFLCTTNHLDFIDPAALRRFSFKIKFDFMTPAQSAAAYRQFFDREPPAALRELVALTPGDFAAVAKQLRYLDPTRITDGGILRMLGQEITVKGLPAHKIGF
jgi:SpoVK/Ycf46/Vps4 family AAA+-type ATPase